AGIAQAFTEVERRDDVAPAALDALAPDGTVVAGVTLERRRGHVDGDRDVRVARARGGVAEGDLVPARLREHRWGDRHRARGDREGGRDGCRDPVGPTHVRLLSLEVVGELGGRSPRDGAVPT